MRKRIEVLYKDQQGRIICTRFATLQKFGSQYRIISEIGENEENLFSSISGSLLVYGSTLQQTFNSMMDYRPIAREDCRPVVFDSYAVCISEL